MSKKKYKPLEFKAEGNSVKLTNYNEALEYLKNTAIPNKFTSQMKMKIALAKAKNAAGGKEKTEQEKNAKEERTKHNTWGGIILNINDHFSVSGTKYHQIEQKVIEKIQDPLVSELAKVTLILPDGKELGNKIDAIKYLEKTLIPKFKEIEKAIDKEKQKDKKDKLIEERKELYNKYIMAINRHFGINPMQYNEIEERAMKNKARYGDFGGYLSNDYSYNDDMDRMYASQSYLYPDINYNPYYNHYDHYNYDKPEVFGTNDASHDISSTYIGLLLLLNIVSIVIIICLCGCLIICGLNWFNQRRYSSVRDWKEEDDRV